MSSTTKKDWENLDLNQDELNRMTSALKNDEFKKMFFEYCEELQDPENKKRYEEEIAQLEAERGVDVTFLNPEPGFVVKTSVNGSTKGFINIAISDKIEKPISEVKRSEISGKPGLSWSIPYAQAPPRNDYDKKGVKCLVYDVIFHPEALHLSEKNQNFRTHVIQTACDAIEREFSVKLDRTNLKYPNIKFKGVPHPTVIRKRSENVSEKENEPSPIDSIYPPMPEDTKNSKPKVYKVDEIKNDLHKETTTYTTPNHVIKHRRDVDFSELTNELDAKLNLTIPKELIIDIELPLLNSTSDCKLDVTEKKLYLISETPAKYKLLIDLPFSVNDADGTAKFDRSNRHLVVTLPVATTEKERQLKDLYRQDSAGAGSDIKTENDSLSSTSNLTDKPDLIEVLSTETNNEEINISTSSSSIIPEFLNDDSIKYNFPSNFDCNTLDNELAFTLHVKNVDPQSVEHIKGTRFAHVKFSSLGSGYYPVHYAFYVNFPETEKSHSEIETVDVEVWDNNLILTMAVNNYENLNTYAAGLHENDTKTYQILEEFSMSSINKFQVLNYDKNDVEVNVRPIENTNHIEIEIKRKPKNNNVTNKKTKDDDDDEDDDDEDDHDDDDEHDDNEHEDNDHDDDDDDDNDDNHIHHKDSDSSAFNENKKPSSPSSGKRNKKKNKKRRSFSESYCDDLKAHQQQQQQQHHKKKQANNINTNHQHLQKDGMANNSATSGADSEEDTLKSPSRKIRSYSESRSDDQTNGHCKGILKHGSRYCRSVSESYSSSMDEHSYSGSVEFGTQFCSFDEIPEEDSHDDNGLSESCKKTVRFNDVIRKQLFRMDSSILGQRKKNQKKKNQKQRALQRRNSEGDSADYDEKCRSTDLLQKKARRTSQNDSGVDLSSDGGDSSSCNGPVRSKKSTMNKERSNSASELEFKNSLIFDIEM